MSIDTKAYKRPLAPELAKLPGEMVTRDINDDKRIHPLDPPHIVQHLVKKTLSDWVAKERKQNPIKVAEVLVNAHLLALHKKPERYKVIDQALVDIYRALTIVGRSKKILRGGLLPYQQESYSRLHHIWFDSKDDGSMLKLRPGAEPPDCEREDFLKFLHLTVDLTDWPKAVCDILIAGGINPQELEDAVKNKLAEIKIASTPALGEIKTA